MQQQPLAASSKVRPGAWWYLLAVAILLVGGGLSAMSIYNGVTGLGKGLARVVVPGSGNVTLEEPGTYIVFHEYISNHEGRSFNTQSARALPLNLEMRDRSTGEPVSITASAGNFTYSLSGKAGESIAQFSITEPGEFDFFAAYADAEGPELVLAIGHDIVKSGARIGIGVAGIVGSGFVAMVLFIIIAVMRSRSKRKMAPPYQPPPFQPPPFQPPPSMQA
ncbi:MAG TPA: hypothetical protein VNC78_02130 [Actinomycetota bacterium]|nr:hypothetical protein [Actinomycetota bacterium]